MSEDIRDRLGRAEDLGPEDDSENKLLQLHGALTTLDTAIFDALRALDLALGHRLTKHPKRAPLREIKRLRENLDAITEPVDTQDHRTALEIALGPNYVEDRRASDRRTADRRVGERRTESQGADPLVAGIAPIKKTA